MIAHAESRAAAGGVHDLEFVARAGGPGADLRQYLEAVKSSADGLLKMLNGLLDFSKIEAGKMALENIGAMEGWRRLWAMMKAETGGYAGYIGMKIVLAIVAGIVIGIIGFIFALIILVPAAGVAIAAVLAAKAAGVGWTVYTITLAVVAGCVLLAVFLCFSSLISVPAIVFFPAYSMYFFAARYPALRSALDPALPAVPVPPAPPPIVSETAA